MVLPIADSTKIILNKILVSYLDYVLYIFMYNSSTLDGNFVITILSIVMSVPCR